MFSDRRQAGERLATALVKKAADRPIVLALPRGGVPVAAEVAKALGAPLDILNVRKLGAPTNPEFAFGAVGEGGAVVIDDATVRYLGISDQVRDRLITEALTDIDSRILTLRGGRELIDVTGRTVIVVDDGLATGATAEAAIAVVRHLGAASVVLAVPTGSQQAVDRLEALSDELVCLEIPAQFGSVGAQYESFPQVSQDEVLGILREREHAR
jgi:putative phosphoribosyl transferase